LGFGVWGLGFGDGSWELGVGFFFGGWGSGCGFWVLNFESYICSSSLTSFMDMPAQNASNCNNKAILARTSTCLATNAESICKFDALRAPLPPPFTARSRIILRKPQFPGGEGEGRGGGRGGGKGDVADAFVSGACRVIAEMSSKGLRLLSVNEIRRVQFGRES